MLKPGRAAERFLPQLKANLAAEKNANGTARFDWMRRSSTCTTRARPRRGCSLALASRLRLAPPLLASASRAVRASRSGSAMLSQLWRRGAHREALALECKAMHLLCLSWRNSHRSCTAGHASCRRTCGVARGRSAGPAPPPAARAAQRCNRRTAPALLFRRFRRYRATWPLPSSPLQQPPPTSGCVQRAGWGAQASW